jgi:hypothetical protein
VNAGEVDNANDRFVGADSIGMTRYEEILISICIAKRPLFLTPPNLYYAMEQAHTVLSETLFSIQICTHTPLTHKPIEKMGAESSSTSS